MYVHTNSKFHILAGVSISENDWPITTSYYKALCAKYFPSNNLAEIHTAQLFRGKSPFDKIDFKAMCGDISKFIATAHLSFFGISIDKDQFLIRGLGKPNEIVDRSIEAATTDGNFCLSWSSVSSLSVSVTIQGGGQTCQPNDIRFDFTVTYTPSTCTAGHYQATFKATNSFGSTTANFTGNVYCQFSPAP